MVITYYASDDTMGDTSEEDCSRYRDWAKKELVAIFPEHEIVVTANQSLSTVDIQGEFGYDDALDWLKEEDRIQMICTDLWDDCPWDWIEGKTP